ncbi:hypothetical protein M5X00_32255, partial [Paenibacillus alvei]|uniref:hypothetical protein n=1 Tax=Paenibacillus alvei TaxID=44250 RepID=UPI002280D64C
VLYTNVHAGLSPSHDFSPFLSSDSIHSKNASFRMRRLFRFNTRELTNHSGSLLLASKRRYSSPQALPVVRLSLASFALRLHYLTKPKPRQS